MDGGEIIELIDGKMRLTIYPDRDPQDPRGDFHTSQMFEVTDRVQAGAIAASREAHPLAYAWAHYRERTPFQRDAVTLFLRYAAWCGAITHVWSPPRGPDRVFYLTREDVKRYGFTEPLAVLEGEATEYEAYASGDVWGYVIEQAVLWKRTDGVEGDMVTWEEIDSCWGFYGYAYAVEAARSTWDTYTAH